MNDNDVNALLSADDFTEEQLEEMERVANGAPREWLRNIVLDAVAYLTENPAPQNDDEPEGEPEEEPAEEPQETMPTVVVDPAAEGALNLLAEIRDLMLEVREWVKTDLSELYAHTGFQDAQQEKLARERAVKKFEMMERAVAAQLRRTRETAH